MIKEAIEKIQEFSKPEIILADGRTFSTFQIFELPNEPLAAALATNTLQSVKDYFDGEIDNEPAEDTFIHVVDHCRVRILKGLNGDRKRECLLEAKYANNNLFSFGSQYDQASIMTALQSEFVKTDEREVLQKLVGGLTDESSNRLTDDGVSQQTVVKVGVTTNERVENKNFWKLSPFRTFAEIEQPESAFILRLHKKQDAPPAISIHEADNSAWKLAAINSIKEWLKDTKVPVIG